jgi:hypothetical protein
VCTPRDDFVSFLRGLRGFGCCGVCPPKVHPFASRLGAFVRRIPRIRHRKHIFPTQKWREQQMKIDEAIDSRLHIVKFINIFNSNQIFFSTNKSK